MKQKCREVKFFFFRYGNGASWSIYIYIYIAKSVIELGGGGARMVLQLRVEVATKKYKRYLAVEARQVKNFLDYGHHIYVDRDQYHTGFQPCFVLLHSRATVMMWASIVRPSVDIVFRKPSSGLTAKFGDQVPIYHIPRPFLLLLLLLLFFFVVVFVWFFFFNFFSAIYLFSFFFFFFFVFFNIIKE